MDPERIQINQITVRPSAITIEGIITAADPDGLQLIAKINDDYTACALTAKCISADNGEYSFGFLLSIRNTENSYSVFFITKRNGIASVAESLSFSEYSIIGREWENAYAVMGNKIITYRDGRISLKNNSAGNAMKADEAFGAELLSAGEDAERISAYYQRAFGRKSEKTVCFFYDADGSEALSALQEYLAKETDFTLLSVGPVPDSSALDTVLRSDVIVFSNPDHPAFQIMRDAVRIYRAVINSENLIYLPDRFDPGANRWFSGNIRALALPTAEERNRLLNSACSYKHENLWVIGSPENDSCSKLAEKLRLLQ